MSSQPTLQPSLFKTLAHKLPVTRCTKTTLTHLSHTLEDIVLKENLTGAIFAGFQKSRYWRVEASRYHGFQGSQVFIFTEDGKDNSVNHIRLDQQNPLCQEWFLLILTARFSVFLCAEDVMNPTNDEETREFDAIWSFEPKIIQQALEILLPITKQHYPYTCMPQPQPAEIQLVNQFTVQLVAFQEHLNDESRLQRNLLNSILESITYQVFVLHYTPPKTIKITYSSPSYAALFGYNARQMHSYRFIWHHIIHPDDREKIFQLLQNIDDIEEDSVHRFRIIHKNNEVRWVEVSAKIRREISRYSVYGLIHDITDKVKIEEAEAEQHRLEGELSKERELNMLKTLFMNTVMHEFRTPLSTIMSSSELLERYSNRYTEEQRINRLKTIQRQVLYLREMLDDIMLTIRGENADMGFDAQNQPIRPVLEGIVKTFKDHDGTDHRILEAYDTNLNTGKIDQKLVRYILTNLLSNAAKFSPKNTVIEVIAKREDNQTMSLIVRDEGLGIPEEDQSHIFDSFHRGANVQNINGLGLGLRITADCVALHRGKIQFNSMPNIGTTFIVTIPV